MTTVAAKAILPGVDETSKREPRRLPVLSVQALLDTQQTLTAVERFAEKHTCGAVPAAGHYRELVPLEKPRDGQQYAFEVDLDLCTGCKACVAACHTLNGLDEAELWRTVGLLHGGTQEQPAQQTVTTSCHHCVEPACMEGCPVGAYEKDPVTGIVKHLDDQCFGCQYCTLMCPYDAPKYNKNLGIVRKCDMCSDRLGNAEAPACVNACPNEAISIKLVERAAVVEASDAHAFLPGAPAPEHTLPTTVYKTAKVMPRNMLPADFYHTAPEHSHPPLVIMLTLTQLAVGAFSVALLADWLSGHHAGSPLAQTAFACLLAFVALGASVFHLGRPWLAWRAFIGLRTSWLSREAVAFGVFAKFAVLSGLLAAMPLLPDFPGRHLVMVAAPVVPVVAAVVGLLGVFCSVMVYVATRRAQWSGTQSSIKFFGTTMILGASSVLAVYSFTQGATPSAKVVADALLYVVLGCVLVKGLFEASTLLHARSRHHSVLKRMALLMLGDLKGITRLRFAAAVVGGIAMPTLLLSGAGADPGALQVGSAVMLVVLLAGELTERYLFFRAAPASRMPGGIR